jgi:hypothetical protein
MAVAPGFGAAGSLGKRSISQFQKTFFDREVVQRAMSRTVAKALSRFGAFVRQRAKTSLRYREAPSSPGRPPSVHRSSNRRKTNRKTGLASVQRVSPLREFILFAYDPARESVVIGPAKTNQRNAEGIDVPIPAVIEYGGAVTIREHLVPDIPAIYGPLAGQWIRTDLRYRISEGGARSGVGRPQRTRRAHHHARPFMSPAFDAELPGFLASLKDSI